MRQRQEVQEVLPPLRGSPAPPPVSAEGERPQISTLSNLSEPRFPHDANSQPFASRQRRKFGLERAKWCLWHGRWTGCRRKLAALCRWTKRKHVRDLAG